MCVGLETLKINTSVRLQPVGSFRMAEDNIWSESRVEPSKWTSACYSRSSYSARLSLNSKRVTVKQLKRIAAALEVPTSASGDELRQMLESKLEERGHEPQNVLVMLLGPGTGSGMELHDDGGCFLEVSPEETPLTEEEESGSEPESKEVPTLCRQLEDAEKQIDSLRSEVRMLT